MFVGVIIFILGTKHFEEFDVKKEFKKGTCLFKNLSCHFGSFSFFGILGWMIPGSIVGSDSTDAFIFACVPVLYFYSSLYFNAAKEEKRPILALLAIFAVVILFWAVFKQNGSALNTWADRYTDREITGVTKSTFETFKLAKI